MSMRTPVLNGLSLGFFLMAAVSALVLVSCSARDEETAIRELVERAARLAEEHDIGGIIDLTTEDFQAQPGSMDRKGAKRILFLAFRHYGDMKVLHPRPSVKLESGDEGPSVSIPFLVVKKGQDLLDLGELYADPKGWVEKVGESADLYRFRLKVAKVDGDWRVRRAYLDRFTGTGFDQ